MGKPRMPFFGGEGGAKRRIEVSDDGKALSI